MVVLTSLDAATGLPLQELTDSLFVRIVVGGAGLLCARKIKRLTLGKTMTTENNSQTVIRSHSWVYEHLVCEFNHWDVCLTGLVKWEGEMWFCRILPSKVDSQYSLHKVNWTPECTEYLDDYRKSFAHWFHEGKPQCSYDGRPLKWFEEKWQHHNPIEDSAERGVQGRVAAQITPGLLDEIRDRLENDPIVD